MTNKKIELFASLKLLNNPKMVVKNLNSDTNIDNIDEIVSYLKKLSDDEVISFIPELAGELSNYKHKYKTVYEKLKSQIKKEENHISRSISPDDISLYLQVIKDNWEAIAILACFFKSLGSTELHVKSGSVFEGISKIIKKNDDE